MPARLKKTAILRGRGVFTKLFTEGRTHSAGAIRCFYSIQEGNPKSPQAGFTVTRNVKNAAIRNRVKRLMRESWRRRQGELQAKNSGVQIAFLYYKNPEKKNLHLQHIDGMIQKLIEKLNQT
ncbi:MAG TPA: ribonuclease P protein component [Bacteroidota bacterium]